MIVPTSVNQSAPTDRKTPPIDKPKQPVSSKPTGTTPPQVENKPKIEQPKATNNGNTSQGQSVSSSGWKVAKVSINDFFNRKQGSTVLAAVVIGHAEGNIDKNGNPRPAYYGHTDPGDKLWNIGSFSRANARFPKSPPARSPQEADQMHLKTLQSDLGKFTNALQKAGLDPENVWLQSTYFDALNQAGGDIANKMLEPKQLEYVRKNGVTPETIKEWRMRGFINRETGQRWIRQSGRMKGVPLGSSFKTEAALSHDQQRRADAVAEILKNVNLIQKTSVSSNTETAKPVQAKPSSVTENSAQGTSTSSPAKSTAFYRVRNGILLTENARQKMDLIGREYFKQTGKTIEITSGTRTPYRQANAMYQKILLGDKFSEYTDQKSVREILNAYRQSKASGNSPEEIKQAMTRAIEVQVSNNTYISKHLQGGATDVSLKTTDKQDLNKPAFIRAVRSVTGKEPLEERKPPHFHLQF